MASADVVMKPLSDSIERDENCSSRAKAGEGLRQYYLQHIHDAQLQVRQKTHNLNRLEAQRNELNSRGRFSKIPNFAQFLLTCLKFDYTVVL